jgi:hypothetical protein
MFSNRLLLFHGVIVVKYYHTYDVFEVQFPLRTNDLHLATRRRVWNRGEGPAKTTRWKPLRKFLPPT